MPSLNPASEHLLSSYTTGSDQFSSVAQSCPILFVPMDCPSPTLGACSNSCLSSRWCHHTISSSVVPFSSCLQSFPASGSFPMSQVYWSFSFSISPSNEYSRLISFRMDRFDLLAVQRTLKNLFQHHSWKASILLCSAFFMVQLSHPYMTTGKTIALTRQTFVSKVMFLLFNKLSRLVITFLPKNKCLLISWLKWPSAVIWSPTLLWPNQTLLWTSVGLWSISLDSLLIAAIIK